MRRLQAALPLDWRGGYYANLAHSGFSTGMVEVGGRNACGENVSSSPLSAAENLLRSNTRVVNGESVPSWDQVVITAGIDNTNWGDVLKQVIAHEVFGFRYNASKCNEDIKAWDGFPKRDGSPSNTQLNIRTGVSRITSGLQASASAAHIVWFSYYDIAGTGTSTLRDSPVVPSFCDPAMADATRVMRENIRAGLPVSVTLLDPNLVVGDKNGYLQQFFLSQELNRPLTGKSEINPSGWPHPNRTGADLIGSLLSF